MSSSVPTSRPSQPPASPSDGHGFQRLRKRINELFDQSLEEPFSALDITAWERDFEFSPTVDVEEKKDRYEVRAELPGVKKEDVDLSLQGNALVIKGEKRSESAEEKEGYRYSECSFGSFYRTIPFSTEIDESKVKADFKEGVLKITLPKSAEAPNRSKKIPLT